MIQMVNIWPSQENVSVTSYNVDIDESLENISHLK